MKEPYKLVSTTRAKPLVPVTIGNPKTGKARRFMALVDSGSDTCFFDIEYAKALGLKIPCERTGKIFGVVPDKWVTQYIHRVFLTFDGHQYDVEVGFIRGLSKNGYGILGQNGFFDQVKSITFAKGEIEIIP